MKRILTLAIAMLFVSGAAFAQEKKEAHHRGNGEQAYAEKIGFLTQKLQLTPEEAQVFWPVYNKYNEEAKAASKAVRDARKAMKQKKDEEPVSDAEMTKRVNEYVKAVDAENALLSKYNKQFLKVLPPAKVGKLYNAEEQYRRNMIVKFAERKNHPKPGMKPQGHGPKGECPAGK